MFHPDDFDDESYLDELDTLNDRRAKSRSQFVRRRRLTEETRGRRARELADEPGLDLPDGATRWSTWDGGSRGPEPHPDWLVTELAAVDRELGVLKTGKEADVHLLERYVPDTDRSCLLASKRYRSGEHRLFHRDGVYLEGRKTRESRQGRAIAGRTSFGRNLIAEQWTIAEFDALTQLWNAGAPVPYPVQRVGTELLIEFVGTPDGAAAPRLAETRPEPDELHDLWDDLLASLSLLAREGYAHGDLSAYNLLVEDGRIVLIDLPQIVDLAANPGGLSILHRDVRSVSEWFRGRGLSADVADPDEVMTLLVDVAGL